MIVLDEYPLNKKHFFKLKEFFKEVVQILKEAKSKPVLYGSLGVLAHTNDRTIEVNDIDLLVKEKYFEKIIELLEEKDVGFRHDKKWHVLQIFKEDLKIEIDSIDYWQPKLAKEYDIIKIDGLKMKILTLKSLKEVYRKASESSDDKPEENRKKLELLEKAS